MRAALVEIRLWIDTAFALAARLCYHTPQELELSSSIFPFDRYDAFLSS